LPKKTNFQVTKTIDYDTNVIFEVILFFDLSKDPPNTPLCGREIIGGSVVEFFTRSKCGLLSYFVVSPKERNRGLSREIIRASVDVLQSFGRELDPGLGFCPVFAEANDPNKIPAESDSLTPNVRLGVLHNLGFGLLDCQYVQPPLSKTHKPCEDLLLIVYTKQLNLPYYIEGDEPDAAIIAQQKPPKKKFFVPTICILNWMKEFWISCCGVVDPHQQEPSDMGWGTWDRLKKDLLGRGDKVDVLDLRLRRKSDEDKARL